MSRKTQITQFSLWFLCLIGSSIIVFSSGTFLSLSPKLPDPESYRYEKPKAPLKIYSADNKLIQEYGERQIPISYNEIPSLFIKAILAIEDSRYYSHRGVDIKGILRSIWGIITGSRRGGASTITMQLTKNISFSQEGKYSRKFKEILFALIIERELNKQEILELYLNLIPLGKHAIGIEAAANTYYGKKIKELNLAQLAMLAGLPKKPEKGNPINNPDWALNRRNLVLKRMYDLDYITEDEYLNSVASAITAKEHHRHIEIHAPYVAEMVRNELFKHLGNEAYSLGLQVITTVDSRLQYAANRSLTEGLLKYDRDHGFRTPKRNLTPGEYSYSDWQEILATIPIVGGMQAAVVDSATDQEIIALIADGTMITIDWQGYKWANRYINENKRSPRPRKANKVVQAGDLIRVKSARDGVWQLAQIPLIQGALVSLNPTNGAITALVGGFDFQQSHYNRATQATRQPGSNFKPFIYSAALERKSYTAAKIINDAPIVFDDVNLETTYRPKNHGNTFGGPTRLRKALYKSINIVSHKLLLDIGVDSALEYATLFGFKESQLPQNTQLAIGGGTAAVTPLDMVTAYAVFANGGYKVEPFFIDRIKNFDDQLVYQAAPITVCTDCDDELANEMPSHQGLDILKNININNQQYIPGISPVAKRVIDERVCYIMTDIMKDVIWKGSSSRARQLKRKDVAGKTGTTDEAANLWFSGFNADVVATTYIGFDDPSSLGRYGNIEEEASFRTVPIWTNFMRVALADSEERSIPLPDGLVSIRIDPESGLRAKPEQVNGIFEIFREELAPKNDVVVDNANTEKTLSPDTIF